MNAILRGGIIGIVLAGGICAILPDEMVDARIIILPGALIGAFLGWRMYRQSNS